MGIAAASALSNADPRDWVDWAFARGIPGVLALVCIVFSAVIVRLYRENARLHHEHSALQEQHVKEASDLEREIRAEQKDLLKDQVKLAGANAKVIAELRNALIANTITLEQVKEILTQFLEDDKEGFEAPPTSPEDLS